MAGGRQKVHVYCIKNRFLLQVAYEAAVRLHRSVEAEVGDRARLPRSSLGFTTSTQRLRSMSSDLTSELSGLRQSLSRLGPQLTSQELNRRRDLLEDLSRKAGSVRDSITDSGGRQENRRSQLLEDLGTTSWAATPGTRAEHLPTGEHCTLVLYCTVHYNRFLQVVRRQARDQCLPGAGLGRLKG